MYELPVTVEVNDTTYAIRNRADYRTIIGVIALSTDPELTPEERALSALIAFYDDLEDIDDIAETFGYNIDDAVSAMFRFIDCAYEDDGVQSNTGNIKLIDWVQDEKLITAAINNVVKTEIRQLEYLHWWTFISYYMSIGESSLSTVVSIRSKIAKGQKLEKHEQRFRKENPQYFRWKNEIIEEQQLISQIWNQDKKEAHNGK